MPFAQYLVLRQRAVKQPVKPVFVKRTESVDLGTRQQRTYHLERRVLRSGAYKCDHSLLDSSEQGILLRFVEPVYFVNEKYGTSLGKHAACVFLAAVENLTDILYAGSDRAQCVERNFRRCRDDTRKSGFPYTRRTP